MATPLAMFAAGYEVHNQNVRIEGSQATAATNMIIGPAAIITINGDWYVTASSLYIHPTAVITGTGTLHLMSPNTYGSPATSTNLDGGGVPITCKLSIENASTVVLAALNPNAGVFAGSGITDPGGAGTNNLVIGNTINFNNANAHVVLGDNNVLFNAGAPTTTYTDLNTDVSFVSSPTPGVAADAYFVTSGIGKVVKNQVANNASFTFPVGQSTAADYTPAVVTNTSGNARDINVQVKNYATSGSIERNDGRGIDRTWDITGSGGAGTAMLELTHNGATETFDPGNTTHMAFVTQQTASGVWDVSAIQAFTAPPYTHSRAGITVPGASETITKYFSKSDDQVRSLSIIGGFPDLALLSTVLPSAAFTASAETERDVVLNMEELSGNSTNNAAVPVTVRVFKSSSTFTYSFNGAATGGGFTPYNNDDWTLTTNNASFLVFTLKPGRNIAGYGVGGLMFKMKVLSGASMGAVNMIAVIEPGSGTDNNDTNNSTYKTLTIN